ncbi:MAG: hypothetical protein WBQ94_09465 [Terracidiphilus sp.]
MEADWEFEVGGEAPVIDAHWPGFVDLRRVPEKAHHLPETTGHPGLADALVKLNAADSLVWTSKCDVWPVVDSTEFDADELDAPPEFATNAVGCYIDLLPRNEQQWITPERTTAACKHICDLLHAVPLRCCRVDLIIRRAVIKPHIDYFGITAYLTACGASEVGAVGVIQDALCAFADALCGHSTLQ